MYSEPTSISTKEKIWCHIINTNNIDLTSEVSILTSEDIKNVKKHGMEKKISLNLDCYVKWILVNQDQNF